MIVAAHSRGIRVADRQGIESLFRLILILQILVTIATIWVAVWQGQVLSAQPSYLYSSQHRAAADRIRANNLLARAVPPVSSCVRGAAVFL